jgi:hypothetical protein
LTPDSLEGPEDIFVTEDTPPETPSSWRSLLYPEDWTPSTTHESEAFLHDFSWAGYQNGEQELPEGIVGFTIDVTSLGADPSASSDSTSAIQAAIDEVSVAGGGVVYFPTGLYRLDDHITVTSSQVILKGDGPAASQLYFTRTTSMTDASSITFTGANTVEAEVPLIADAEARSHVLSVEDASVFEVGDDIEIGWTITEAFVESHGMTGTWQAFNGTYMTFFRRDIISIDSESTPNKITVDAPTRYPALVSNNAKVRRVSGMLKEVGVRDLGLANAISWDAAWSYDRAHVLAMDYVADGFVANVHSFNPPTAPQEALGQEDHLQSGGIIVRFSKRVTIKDCDMREAENRGSGGNGYLFEILQSSEILHDGCVAHAGRHNFIQNWGFGTTGCVWKDCISTGGEKWFTKDIPFGVTGFSEYHHSLATANLVDGGTWDDGWGAVNRGSYSSGAGHSSTQCVFWRLGGTGSIESRQYGQGYVIGTAPDISVYVGVGTFSSSGEGTEPEDWVEGEGEADTLEPASLYNDQLARRLGIQ